MLAAQGAIFDLTHLPELGTFTCFPVAGSRLGDRTDMKSWLPKTPSASSLSSEQGSTQSQPSSDGKFQFAFTIDDNDLFVATETHCLMGSKS